MLARTSKKPQQLLSMKAPSLGGGLHFVENASGYQVRFVCLFSSSSVWRMLNKDYVCLVCQLYFTKMCVFLVKFRVQLEHWEYKRTWCPLFRQVILNKVHCSAVLQAFVLTITRESVIVNYTRLPGVRGPWESEIAKSLLHWAHRQT
jgi:hypothetical protein